MNSLKLPGKNNIDSIPNLYTLVKVHLPALITLSYHRY